MRYRIGSEASQTAAGTGDVVLATVWTTLLIGVVFIFLGIRGRQLWLQFWGGLTVFSCGLYFFRGLLGLDRLLS